MILRPAPAALSGVENWVAVRMVLPGLFDDAAPDIPSLLAATREALEAAPAQAVPAGVRRGTYMKIKSKM